MELVIYCTEKEYSLAADVRVKIYRFLQLMGNVKVYKPDSDISPDQVSESIKQKYDIILYLKEE